MRLNFIAVLLHSFRVILCLTYLSSKLNKITDQKFLFELDLNC